MGNGYNHHQNINFHQNQKSTFLPMLCSKPSMKDVSLPRLQKNRRSASFSGDPLSPKIGCMGQVKRHGNKIEAFPNSNSNNKISISTTPLPSFKYSKLKRIFSAKNPTNLFPATAKSMANSGSFREKGESFNGGIRGGIRREIKIINSVIKIEEMDPPLPVVKKVGDGSNERESESLWKRRRSSCGLKNLQLQQIQINRHNLELTTV